LIKIGIAGLGRLGKIHLDHLSSLEGFEIAGLFDINAERLAQTSRESGFQAFSDFNALLAKCGAVLIATPTSTHFKYAEVAIRQGKHVFIEKPIVDRASAARKLIDLSEEAGVLIQIGHVERFNPAFCAIKNRPLEPRFIESHRLAQFDVRGTDVSVVLDLMIHDIDIVLSIVNSNVKRVHASGIPVVTDSIDIANARIEFDNGTVANLTASRISFKKMRKMRIFQHNEYLGIDFLNKKVDLFRMSAGAEQGGHAIFPDKPDQRIHLEQPEVQSSNAIREELKAFRHCILTGQEPEVDALQATLALELADQILHKIRKNYQLSE